MYVLDKFWTSICLKEKVHLNDKMEMLSNLYCINKTDGSDRKMEILKWDRYS
jgi:hypothetical protein